MTIDGNERAKTDEREKPSERVETDERGKPSERAETDERGKPSGRAETDERGKTSGRAEPVEGSIDPGSDDVRNDDHTASVLEYVDDVPDGCGCAEIWST